MHINNNGTMVNGPENGLKGQHILAQGKRRRSVALGWKKGIKIVRAISFIKEIILFRTSEMTLYFSKMMYYNSDRKKLFALFFESSRSVFLLHPLPRAAFRFVPLSPLPWAEICWPFRPEKQSSIILCIKGCFRSGMGGGF